MVQFKEDWANSSEYWKLTNAQKLVWNTKSGLISMLEQHKVRCAKGTNKKRLIQLIHHAERGLLSYDICSPLELRSFCAARRLPVKPKSLASKRAMVRILEAADDRATFTWFADLPTETRLTIYKIYFQDMAVVCENDMDDARVPGMHPRSRNFMPPPVVSASTLSRREALPAWFQFWTFDMYLSFVPMTWEHQGVHIHNGQYFRNMPAEHLSLVRHVKVSMKLVLAPPWSFSSTSHRTPDPLA